MIAVILAGALAVVSIGNFYPFEEKKLIDENLASIKTVVEKIDGATKMTRTVIVPDKSTFKCNTLEHESNTTIKCLSALGEEEISLDKSGVITSSMHMDMKRVKCTIDRGTQNEPIGASCVERTQQLNENEFVLEQVAESVTRAWVSGANNE